MWSSEGNFRVADGYDFIEIHKYTHDITTAWSFHSARSDNPSPQALIDTPEEGPCIVFDFHQPTGLIYKRPSTPSTNKLTVC
jgi:hypothetical protein